ncbi:lycopene cyclase family protein [Quadrisphaera sp. DSM 44207]|uniref:lycopene cyclase family protein n=1 Tax=Quadrisphaera sp. DSM 44207 TaxID=1881057 RepID=UPI000B861189|nr:lycopene cyclase family protein [Quadrisphaera sp. DSM 44207]
MRSVDVALVGAGGAGLAVLHQLARAAPAGRRLRVALVDPLDRLAERPADRTWCSWDDAASPAARELAPAVHRSWRAVSVVDPGGVEHVLDLGRLRYAMVRSEDWYGLVADAVAAAARRRALDVVRVPAPAGAVVDAQARAVVSTAVGAVAASWVLDSRPAPPARAGATALLQHFRGVRVRTGAPALDPQRAVLMDLAVAQPRVGLAFGYCLPSDERTALVEHTEFSPAVLDDAGYEAALGALLPRALGGAPVEAVEHVEQGAIPMTDAAFARRAGRRVLRIGTGGGAVRPSTGYAFSALQRSARAVAAQVLAGRPVLPPRPYPRRHAWMDALVLRALADGSLDGPSFFPRLFTRNPPERVLRFLDGTTGPAAELALMATAPRGPMLRALARDAAWRVTMGR